jgi:hypothetical protein
MAYLGPNAPAITASEMMSFYDPMSVGSVEASVILCESGPDDARSMALARFDDAVRLGDDHLVVYWGMVYTQIGDLEDAD